MPDPQYLTVNDFRPGININVRSDGASPTILDMPPGTADINTTGCYALAGSGALVPLPKPDPGNTQVFTMSGALHSGNIRPIGLFTCGPLAVSTGATFSQNAVFADELHVMFQGVQSGAPTLAEFEWHIRKLYFVSPPSDLIINADGIANYLHGCTGITARLRDSSFTNPGFPTFITEWSEAPVPGFADVTYFYPNPTNTTVDSPLANLNFGPNQLAILSGRILFLRAQRYSHGANNGVYLTNEDIIYTDPPNSDVYTSNQPTVLDADSPSGFMSWGSLTYGELFLVRRDGGALVIDGDIYAPNTSILKGVKSAGALMNVASPSITGLVYCVDNDGAYMWEGGNTSRKISTIPDRFYDRVNGNPVTGVQVKHTRWGQFIAFPNGWLFDTLTEAWWNLDNTADIALVESGKGNPNFLWTAPDQFVNASNCTVHCYDLFTPNYTYTWTSQSYPILPNRFVDAVEVIVSVAHVAAAGASCAFYIEDQTGVLQNVANFNFTDTSSSGFPTTQRVSMPNLGIQNVNHIRVKAVMTSLDTGTAAPTLLNFSIGYLPSTDLPQQAHA